MAAPLFGIFALGWLFSRWVNSPLSSPSTGSLDPLGGDDTSEGGDGLETPENGLPEQPPIPVSPDTIGKPLFYIESVHTGNEGRVVFCLYQLTGTIYEINGVVEDNSSYEKVGFIVGNTSGTQFKTESGSGGFEFMIDGEQFQNVIIYTKSKAIEEADKQEEEEEPPIPPSSGRPSLPDFGSSYRRTGIL